MKSTRLRPSLRALAVSIAALLAAPGARAAISYWDANGSTAGAGATPAGIWGTDAFWTASAAGLTATAAYTGGSDAVFSAGSDATTASITVTGTQTAASLSFEDGATTLGGASGVVSLGGAGSVNVGFGASATLGNGTGITLAGTAGLAKAGAGALTLNGSAVNPLTGGLALTGGTLALDFVGLATPTDLLAATNSLTLAGGALTLKGKGSATPTAQTFAGVTVSAGGGSILVNPQLNRTTNLALGSLGDLSTWVAGSSLLAGTAVSALGTANVITTTAKDAQGIYGGRIVFANGTASTGYDWATSAGAGPNYTLSAYTGYTTLTSSPTSDPLNYRLTAAATLSHSFIETVNSLKLAPTGPGQILALGTGTLTITSGGLLVTGSSAVQITGSSSTGLAAGNGSGAYDLIIHQFNPGGLTISAAIGDNGNPTALTKAGTGLLLLTGANNYTGPTAINAGTLQLGNAAALYGGNTADWTAANLAVQSGANLSLNVGGAGEFTTGHITTLLAALDTTISNNGLKAGSALGFDTANATGGSFSITAPIANTTGPGGGAVGLGKLGVGTLILTGTNTYTGNTTISGGALEIGGATGQLAGGAYAGAIAITAGTLRFNTAASQTLSGAITQTGSLVKDGAGTLTLTSASSSGSGSTTVNAGTLRIENSVNALRGNVALGAAGTLVLTAPVSGGLIAYNNTVSGSGLLRITGMTSFGRVNLYGNTTGFTGTLEVGDGVNSGRVVPANGVAQNFSRVRVLNAAQLYLYRTNLSGAVDLYGGFTAEATGQLRLAGDGVQTVLSGPVTLYANSSIGDNAGVISGVIGESGGSFGVNFTGSTILRGVNTYTGPTTVSGTGLYVGNNSGDTGTSLALQSTSYDVTGAGTRLHPQGGITNIVVGGLTGTGSLTMDSTVQTLTLHVPAGPTRTLTHAVSGGSSFGLGKMGAGTLIIGLAEALTGASTVNDGTMRLGLAGAIPAGLPFVVNATAAGGTATFDLAGQNLTIGTSGVSGLTFGGPGASATGTSQIIGAGSTLTLAGGSMALTGLATGNPLGATISVPTVDLGGGFSTFTVADSTNAAADLTITSTIQNGDLTVAGPGTVRLDGAQHYFYLTVGDGVSPGTLLINGPLGLGPGSATVDVTAGARLKFGSISQSLANLSIAAGASVTFTSGVAASAGSGSAGKAPGFAAGAVVPEPGACALLLPAALGFLARRRRRGGGT